MHSDGSEQLTGIVRDRDHGTDPVIILITPSFLSSVHSRAKSGSPYLAVERLARSLTCRRLSDPSWNSYLE